MDTEYGYSCQGYNNIRSSNNNGENVGVNEYGKLKVRTDCKIVSDVLTLDRIKASRLALEGGAIISRIMQIEKECKIEY